MGKLLKSRLMGKVKFSIVHVKFKICGRHQNLSAVIYLFTFSMCIFEREYVHVHVPMSRGQGRERRRHRSEAGSRL